MLVQQENEDAYFNFINSINSEATRISYEYYISRFLKYCNLDLESLLKLSQQELSNLIIKYLVAQKISSQYKTVIMAAIKHACEMNDVILNWKKPFNKSENYRTHNILARKQKGKTQILRRPIGTISRHNTRTGSIWRTSSIQTGFT